MSWKVFILRGPLLDTCETRFRGFNLVELFHLHPLSSTFHGPCVRLWHKGCVGEVGSKHEEPLVFGKTCKYNVDFTGQWELSSVTEYFVILLLSCWWILSLGTSGDEWQGLSSQPSEIVQVGGMSCACLKDLFCGSNQDQGWIKEPDMGVCIFPPPTPEESLGWQWHVCPKCEFLQVEIFAKRAFVI